MDENNPAAPATDYLTSFQNFIAASLHVFASPYMVWLYIALIIGAWFGTIMVGYFFRRSFSMFVFTMTLSYAVVAISSIMIWRSIFSPSSGASWGGSSGNDQPQIVFYHKTVPTPTPAPAPQPAKGPWWWPF